MVCLVMEPLVEWGLGGAPKAKEEKGEIGAMDVPDRLVVVGN